MPKASPILAVKAEMDFVTASFGVGTASITFSTGAGVSSIAFTTGAGVSSTTTAGTSTTIAFTTGAVVSSAGVIKAVTIVVK